MLKRPTCAHPWRFRLIMSLILLILGFLGVILTNIEKTGGWFYWRLLIPIYALVSLFTSWYLKEKEKFSLADFWHEILHWLGLILAIYLISKFVSIGLIGRFEAGLVTLAMLALTTFLAGIYIEATLILVGLALGFFAYALAFLEQYLYAIILPVAIAIALFIFWLVYHQHKIERPH